MSLDVYLYADEPVIHVRPSIYVREGGRTREVTQEEWEQMHPEGLEPAMAPSPFRRSLMETDEHELYWANITHNLVAMAAQARLYDPIWRPDSHNIEKARALIPYLTQGLETLEKNPEFFRAYDAKNGWGTYDQFVAFVQEYLEACEKYPDANIKVSR